MLNRQELSDLDNPDQSTDAAFDGRFRGLLADLSEQDEAVRLLLEAQGVDRDELEDMDVLPDDVADQLDAAADEQLEELRLSRVGNSRPTFSAYALRA